MLLNLSDISKHTVTVSYGDQSLTLEVSAGTSLLELVKLFDPAPLRAPIAAYVNNRIREVSYRLYTPAKVKFIDMTDFEGIRVYQRTAWFILQKAVNEIDPSTKLHIRHSIGKGGFYCEIEGKSAISNEVCEKIKQQMQTIVEQNIPITRLKLPTTEVRERFEAIGFDSKVALLDSRPRLYSQLLTLGTTPGYFFGAAAPSSSYLTLFDIAPYRDGFILALPTRCSPDKIETKTTHQKIYSIFQEYQDWCSTMGVPTTGALNNKIAQGDTKQLIAVAEAFHERTLGSIADQIKERKSNQKLKMVLLSGPSSSGKTTTAKRLAVHLQVLGLNPVLISMDDYFVDRDKTPKDSNGEYDFEALEAIDIALFNQHLGELLEGKSVTIPRYDFISGSRKWHPEPLTLSNNAILVIEGIHALNPRLTPSFKAEEQFKIYASCLTSLALDNLNRISSADNRLLRRMVRDYRTRGNDAIATLSRWESVRRGEEKHIFPYQENADVMFNTSLLYEISVIKHLAEPLLRTVPDTCIEYDKAHQMLKFLDNFNTIDPTTIPPTSIVREFIGGSAFDY